MTWSPAAAEATILGIILLIVAATVLATMFSLRERAADAREKMNEHQRIVAAEIAEIEQKRGPLDTTARPTFSPTVSPTGATSAQDSTDTRGIFDPLPDIPWTAVLLTGGGLVTLAGAGAGGTHLRRGHQRRSELADNIRDRWAAARAKHDTIADEYATLRLDPIAAIDHIALWDVTDSFTEKFTLAYAKAADTIALHRIAAPTQPELVDAYTDIVNAAHLAWTSARDHARARGITVLPRADQATARRAKAALALSQNTAATDHERATAAHTAEQLLASLHTIRFPDETRTAILTVARPQLLPA